MIPRNVLYRKKNVNVQINTEPRITIQHILIQQSLNTFWSEELAQFQTYKMPKKAQKKQNKNERKSFNEKNMSKKALEYKNKKREQRKVWNENNKKRQQAIKKAAQNKSKNN